MQAYDLERSFEKGQLGCEHKALYDAAGNKVGSSALWEAGADAYHLLQSKFPSVSEDPAPVTASETRFAVMQQMVTQYLDEEVAVALGTGQPTDRHRTAVQAWTNLKLPSKALFLLELLDAGRAPRVERAGFYDFLRVIAAVALLMRLDEAIFVQDRAQTIAAIAARAKRHAVEGGKAATESEQAIMDVATFRRVINAEHSAGAVLRKVRKNFANRASAGAHGRAAGFTEARAFAEAEWKEHRAAYSGNKSAFARDYSRRIANEKGVQVKDRTVYRWIADLG